MSTPQTQSVGLINDLIGLVQTATTVAGQIDSLYTLWTNAQTGDVIRAFPTAAFMADGTLGSPDATPDSTHPMDTRNGLPADGITRALSANDVVGIITSLLGVRDVIRGQPVAANGATVQLFAKCIGA